DGVVALALLGDVATHSDLRRSQGTGDAGYSAQSKHAAATDESAVGRAGNDHQLHRRQVLTRVCTPTCTCALGRLTTRAVDTPRTSSLTARSTQDRERCSGCV